MPDPQNVVSPDANSTAPSPAPVSTNLTGAGVDQPIQPSFTSMLQQQLAQPQAAPPQAPSPVVPPQNSLLSTLLRGAIAGAAGGLKGGLEDVAAAGQRPTRGMGMAYGEQNAADLQAKEQQKQQQAQQQQQQAFENAKSTYEMNAQQQRDRALNLQSLMGAYHMAQEMDAAPIERQQEYQKGQQELLHQYADVQQLTPYGTFQGLPAVMQWMQQHPTTPVQQVHITDPQGRDQITLFPMSQAMVSSEDANAQMKAIGSDFKYPPGTQVRADQLHNNLGQQQLEVSKQIGEERMQRLRNQEEDRRQAATFGHEEAMEKQREDFQTQLALGKPPAFLNAIKPIDTEYRKGFTDAGNQITKVDAAKQLVNGNQAGQGLSAAKVLTATVSGQGSGVRITMPELQMFMQARGIKEDAQAWLNHITGNSEYADSQRQQISQVLDDVKSRLMQKQAVYNDGLNKLHAAGNYKDATDVDKNQRQTIVDMESGKIPLAGQPQYQTSPSTGRTRMSTDGGKTWTEVTK